MAAASVALLTACQRGNLPAEVSESGLTHLSEGPTWATLSGMARLATKKLSFINYMGPALAVGFLLLLSPLAPRASGTWKCTTADGGVAYVNNHVSDYKHCARISVPGLVKPQSASPAPEGTWQYRETRATEKPPQALKQVSKAKRNTRVVKGAVYRVRRDDGVSEYTNIRPRGNGDKVALLFHYIATCRACEVHSSIDWATIALKPGKYLAQISKAATDYGVDRSLLRALIHAESGFDPQALSHAGAQGLTQLMPATATSMGVSSVFDPDQNIRGGARYLAGLLKTFKGDVRLATAAYNAGPGAVKKYGGVPPYAETQVYVDRVGLLAKRYRAAGGGSPTIPPGATGAVTAAAN